MNTVKEIVGTVLVAVIFSILEFARMCVIALGWFSGFAAVAMVAAVLQFNTGLQDWVFASALAGVAGAVALTCYGAYKEFFQVAPAP